MAIKSTVYKAELCISDIDRHYYATHELVVAKHPSEPDRRIMARLLVFARFAHEHLEFGKGVSTGEEPDLWRRDLTGKIEQWIELGQPDEAKVRKAAGIADEVIIVNYRGHSADNWWGKNADALTSMASVKVLEINLESLSEATELLQRRMDLTFTVQDSDSQLSDGTACVSVSFAER